MMILLSILIILGFAVNALMDGIAFTKSPQGRDLKILWHSAKYVWVGIILLTGMELYIQYISNGFTPLVFWIAGAVILGCLIWRVTYKIYRKIDWPDWA